MRNRWIKRLAPVAVLAMFVAACGGDDDESDADTASATAEATATAEEPATTVAESSATAEEPATTVAESSATTEVPATTVAESSADAGDPLGEPNAASGEPVKIGLITEEGGAGGGAQGSQTSIVFGIAAQYVNEYLGGIAGRPIEIWECGNSSTPAGAQDCAQQAVEQNVVAVVLPFDCCGDDQVPIVVGRRHPVRRGIRFGELAPHHARRVLAHRWVHRHAGRCREARIRAGLREGHAYRDRRAVGRRRRHRDRWVGVRQRRRGVRGRRGRAGYARHDAAAVGRRRRRRDGHR